MMINNRIEALYIHIPFCSYICNYCDFYKMIAKPQAQEKYIDYLIKEIELKKDLFKDIKTVYIGGGTPSTLPISSLNKLLKYLWNYLDYNKVSEFTIEANPIDINQALINIIKNNHVNRVSLGVQSFNDNKLKFLGRKHNAQIATNAINLLKTNGINNISCDLIYATPNDDFEVVKRDLETLVDLNIPHISAYSLILEEKTILYHRYKKGQFEMIDEDSEFDIYDNLQQYLANHGYHQYEVSNYALPNMESKHNLVYWNNQHYLGIGAGASYYIDNVRYTNIKNLASYYQGIDEGKLNYSEEKTLSTFEQMQEELLMGFRKTLGISINQFQNKYHKDVFSVFPIINDLLNKDLLALKDNYIFIPKHRLYLSNSILIHFI